MNEMKNNTLLTERQRQRREAEQLLATEVAGLLGHGADEQLKWTGTSTDLMEALYTAYATGLLTNNEGNPLSFMTIVRRACRVLHVGHPLNPYDAARRGRNRKGVLCYCYMDRYCRHMADGDAQPLWRAIRRS